MAIEHSIQYIPPKGEFETFENEDLFKEKLKEWGLPAAKTEFWYKERALQCHVKIKGYETYGNTNENYTLIIEFPDGKLSCIHPAYLKEMQQSSFGKESMLSLDDRKQTVDSTTSVVTQQDAESPSLAEEPQKDEKPKPKAAKAKKEKTPKLVLPADKVHFTATVKQFALTYNAFTEENDEVVVLENVQIQQDEPLDLGLAWCSHSKTLKKFELAPGDKLEFDAKAAAKKLPKGKEVEEEMMVDEPVIYKINNPSKIVKQ